MTEHQDHPLQPIVHDPDGTPRFKTNHLVEFILKLAGGPNKAAILQASFPPEDYDQLMQLTGWSVSGAPLSSACRARVDTVEDGKVASYHQGFIDGAAEALSRVSQSVGELSEELECTKTDMCGDKETE